MAMDLETLAEMVIYGLGFAGASVGAGVTAAGGQVAPAAAAAGAAADMYDRYTDAVGRFWSGAPPAPVSDTTAQGAPIISDIGSSAPDQATNGTPAALNPSSVAAVNNGLLALSLGSSLGTVGDVLRRQSQLQYIDGLFHVGRDFRAPHFRFWMNSFVPTTFEDFTPVPPMVDFEDVGVEEGLDDYLNRVASAYTWRTDLFPDVVACLPGQNGSSVGWFCVLNQYQWDFLRHYQYIPSSGLPTRSTLGDCALMFGLIPVQYPP